MKKYLVFSLLALLFTNVAEANNLYWIGNSGNWSDGNHWSNTSGGSSCGCIPTMSDDVFFDLNSFSSGGQTVTVDQAASFKSMNWTGVTNTPTLAGSQPLNIYGAFTLASAMNFTYNGPLTFASSNTGNIITAAGKTISSVIYFSGAGGVWTLQDAFNSTSNIYHSAGTLNTNNMALTAAFFQSNGSSVRALNLGSSVINITGFSNSPYYYGYPWQISGSNLIFNAGTSTINLTASETYFNSDSRAYYDVNFTGTVGNNLSATSSYHNVSFAGNATLSGDGSFNNLTLGTSKTNNINGTQTVSGTFTCNGTCGIPASLTNGTITKTSGTVAINYVRLQGVTATGGATFNANNVTDFGNNNGWNLNAPATQNLYWIGNGGNWSDPNHWSSTSGGTSVGCIPSPYDNVFFNSGSFSSGGQTVTVDQTAYFKSMSWTGVTNTPTLTGSQPFNIYGSFTLASAMNFTYNGPLTFTSSNTGNTITTAGKTINSQVSFNGAGGAWTLQDAFTAAANIYHSAGTLNTNNVTVSANNFQSNGSSVRALNLGSSVINITGFSNSPYYYGYPWQISGSNLTFNAGTSTINLTASETYFNSDSRAYYDVNFTGTVGNNLSATSSYHNVSFAGNATLSGDGSFNNLTLGTSKTNNINGTQTVSGTFTCNGTCGIPASLINGTITKTSGTVAINYVRLQGVTATGGATFNANNSINLGSNNGWNFTNSSQNLYWIGNGGNWSDPNHWSAVSGGVSVGCIPTIYDDVFFDNSSFNIADQTVTIDQVASCNSISWTGVTNTPTLTGGNNFNIYGSFTLAAAMNFTFTGGLYFSSSAIGNTITTAGKTISSVIYFNGAGGGWTLQDALNSASNLYHSAGTLNTNNMALTAAFFQSNGSSVRALNLGSSVINITGFSNSPYYYGYPWQISGSNLTFNAGTSTINLTASETYFNSDSRAYYDVNFTGTVGNNLSATSSYHNVSFAGNATLSGDGSFNNLTLGTSKTNNINGTQTVSGTFTCNGTCGIPASLTNGTITKTSGTVAINYVRLQGVTATGGATFNANNSVDLGSNTGWAFNNSPQDYYWVGGSGNWSDGVHWSTSSGGIGSSCIPTLNDNVYFDANSFSSGGQTVTVDQTAYFKSMSWTGVTNTPTLTGGQPFNIYGSFTLSSGMNFTYTGGLNFLSSAVGNTITTAGKTINSQVSFNGAGSAWTLQDAFTAAANIYHSAGTLNTNNMALTAAFFQSNGSSVRALNLGSSVINITGFSNSPYYYGYPWQISGSNLTFNAGTSTINLTASETYFNSDSRAYYDVNFTGTVGNNLSATSSYHNVSFAGNATLSGDGSFNNLTLGTSKTNNINGTQTVSGTFTCNGTCGIPASLTNGTITKTSGTVAINYVRLQGVTATGGATFNANNSVDLGSNTGWAFNNSPQDYYWVGGSGNWSDGVHWSTSSGGIGSSCIPTLNDNVYFDANSFSSGGQTVTVDQTAYFKSMSWTGVTNTPTLTGGQPFNIYGSFTLSSGMNFTYTGGLNFLSSAVGNTITTAGKTINSQVSFNGAGGAWTLQDAFTAAANIYHSAGTLNTNNMALTAAFFQSNGSSVRALNLGSSVINITGFSNSPYYYGYPWQISGSNLTFNAGTSTINLTASETYFNSDSRAYYDVNFTGTVGNNLSATSSYHNVSFAGNATLSGDGSFNNLTLGTSKTNNINGTQTVSGTFTCNGTCGIPASLTNGTITKTSGTVAINYVRLQGVTATGGATFNANNVTDFGNNNGWNLNAPATQNLYWIGNGGNWSDPNHWSSTSGGTSVGCIPSPYDNVFFNSGSFSSGGQTVTVDQTAYFKSMSWTGVTNTPTLTGSQPFNIYGSFTLASAMNFTYNGPLTFTSSNTGNTITTAGKTINSQVSFNGAGGAWTLQDAFTAAANIYHSAGTLNTNNVTVSANNFQSNGSSVRALNLGSSVINITGFSNSPYYYGYPWQISGSNLTFNAGTSTINLTASETYFNSDSRAYYDVNFTGTVGNNLSATSSYHNVSFAGNATLSGDGSFNNLTLGTSKTNNINGTQTVSGTFTCNGTCGIPASLTNGTITKTSGTVAINYVRLQGVTATGGATFNANNVTDFGNNNGWNLNAPATQNLYWIGNGGNWSDPNHWSSTSGGTSVGCIPSPYDNVFFNSGSFSSGGQTVTVDQTAYFKSMSWTGVTNTPTLTGSQPFNIYGSFTLSSGMNFTYTGGLYFLSSALGNTVTTAGKTINSQVSFNGAGGAWTLQDAFTAAANIYHSAGTLNTNNVTVSANNFQSNGSSVRALNLGSSVINITGFSNSPYYYGYPWQISGSNLTFNAGTSTINLTASETYFNSDSHTYYDVNFTGTTNNNLQASAVYHNVSFAGNATLNGDGSFNNLTLGTSKTNSIGGTQTVAGTFTCNGTENVNASLNGGIIHKTSGTVCINKVNLSNSIVNGGATFYAGNSQNLGNNNGWIYQSCSAFIEPKLYLGKGSLSAGQIEEITGKDFSLNGQITLYIKSPEGEYLEITSSIEYLPNGCFRYKLPIDNTLAAGEYNVSAVDNATNTCSPIIKFRIIRIGVNKLNVESPSSADIFEINKFVQISWTDFISASTAVNNSAFIQKKYKIEITNNNGNTWQIIEPMHIENHARSNQLNEFNTSYKFTQTGTYEIKVTDVDESSNYDISSSFLLTSQNSTEISYSLEWDASSPKPQARLNPIGLACDGTSRILIKLTKAANNNKSVSSISGTISTITPGASGVSLLGKILYATTSSYSLEGNNASGTTDTKNFSPPSTNSNFYYWLIAPEDFAQSLNSLDSFRLIKVSFTINYSDYSSYSVVANNIKLVRPPIIFVHGLNSNSDAFAHTSYDLQGYGKSYFINSYGPGKLFKYANFVNIKPDGSYSENANILLGISSNYNYGHINNFQHTLLEMHNLGYAVNKVDYIAHSMGGCVARMILSDQYNTFYKPSLQSNLEYKNYGQGFIHKLITLNTPHNGSPEADALEDLLGPGDGTGIINCGKSALIKHYLDEGKFTGMFTKTGRLGIYGGGLFNYDIYDVSNAVKDLRATQEGIIFRQTHVKNHLLGSDIDRDNTVSPAIRSALASNEFSKDLLDICGTELKIGLANLAVDAFNNYINHHYNYQNFLSNSDVVVPVSSEFATTDVNSIPEVESITAISTSTNSYGVDRMHFQITDDPFMGTKIMRLLNSSLSSGYFADNIPRNPRTDGPTYRTQSAIDSTINYLDSTYIKITNPVRGQEIFVDSTFDITLQISDTINLQRIMVIFQGEAYTSYSKALSQTFNLKVHSGGIGFNGLVAEAVYDSSGWNLNHSDTCMVKVKSNDILQGYYISKKTQNLNSNQNFSFVHNVIYPNYIGTLSSNIDSLNFTISDSNVIRYVDSIGSFNTQDTGSAYILFNYKGFIDTAFIYITIPDENIKSICSGSSFSFFSGFIVNDSSYQWQVNTGNGFQNLTDDAIYGGTNSAELILNNAPSSWYGYTYRCLGTGNNSPVFTLKFSSTWLGLTDTTWENPSNWSCGNIPDSSTDVVIPMGANFYPSVNSNVFCRSLSLDTGAAILVKTGYKITIVGKNL